MRQTYTDDSKHSTGTKTNSVQRTRRLPSSDDPVKDDIHYNAVPQGDWGRVEVDPTQGRGTRLNNEIMYNSFPSVTRLRNQGRANGTVDIGFEHPVDARTYLNVVKQTQGKKDFLNSKFAESFRDTMGKKMNSIKDKLDPILNYTSGEYNENDDEYYLGGKKLDYRYSSQPSEWWVRKLLGINGK